MVIVAKSRDDEYKDSRSFARYVNPSDKYGSIRDFGTENVIKARKTDAAKSLAMAVGLSPLVVAAETLAGDMPDQPRGPIGELAHYVASRPGAAIKGVKNAAKDIGGTIDRYKSVREQEEDLDRELASQLKRETRGKAAGGKVSASSRADGCCKRGKTKGRMV